LPGIPPTLLERIANVAVPRYKSLYKTVVCGIPPMFPTQPGIAFVIETREPDVVEPGTFAELKSKLTNPCENPDRLPTSSTTIAKMTDENFIA
jgi:hypothetical protein